MSTYYMLNERESFSLSNGIINVVLKVSLKKYNGKTYVLSFYEQGYLA